MFLVDRGWVDWIFAPVGSSGGAQLPHTVMSYHYSYGRESVQVQKPNQEDKEEAVTYHYLDSNFL